MSSFSPATRLRTYGRMEPWQYEQKLVNGSEVDEAGCWLWKEPLNPAGYGTVSPFGGTTLAHRQMYAFAIGPIPDGLTLDHLCRVRNCINPWHLEPVTQAENARRANAYVTHCPKRHEYTPENTYGKNCRKCRACDRVRSAAARARRRAA